MSTFASLQLVLLQNLFWWFVMSSSLAVLLYFCVVTTLADVEIKTRSQWGAAQPSEIPRRISRAVQFVIIHHSDGNGDCAGSQCAQVVGNIQNFHMKDRKWSDIGYNFIVAPDGEVFEGRGWGVVGAHASNYNSRSIGISLIGSYQTKTPKEVQLKAVRELISTGISLGKIKTSYQLLGHRQVAGTKCPGDNLYDIIKEWPHYESNPKK